MARVVDLTESGQGNDVIVEVSSSEDEGDWRCPLCSEAVPLGEKATHQLNHQVSPRPLACFPRYPAPAPWAQHGPAPPPRKQLPPAPAPAAGP